MSDLNDFPPHYSAQTWPSDEGTKIMRGPVATATDCVWATEIWWRPSVGKWNALIPFHAYKLFDTAAEAVAWIESQRLAHHN